MTYLSCVLVQLWSQALPAVITAVGLEASLRLQQNGIISTNNSFLGSAHYTKFKCLSVYKKTLTVNLSVYKRTLL